MTSATSAPTTTQTTKNVAQFSTVPATVVHVGGCQTVRNTHLASECASGRRVK